MRVGLISDTVIEYQPLMQLRFSFLVKGIDTIFLTSEIRKSRYVAVDWIQVSLVGSAELDLTPSFAGLLPQGFPSSVISTLA